MRLKEHNKKLPIPGFPRNFIQCNNLLNSRKPQEFSFQPDTLDVISLSSNIFKFILSLRIPSIPIEMIKQRNKNKSDEVEGERKERLWSSSGLIIPNGGGKRASLKARHLIYPATCSPQPKRPIKIPNFGVIGPVVRWIGSIQQATPRESWIRFDNEGEERPIILGDRNEIPRPTNC